VVARGRQPPTLLGSMEMRAYGLRDRENVRWSPEPAWARRPLLGVDVDLFYFLEWVDLDLDLATVTANVT
jgi:hypothetical protein